MKDAGNERFFPGSLNNKPADTIQILQYGKILDTVKCLTEPGQSYSLYIPSYYLPARETMAGCLYLRAWNVSLARCIILPGLTLFSLS